MNNDPLEKAVWAVREGLLSQNAAAKKYGVQQSTISRRVREFTHGLRPSDPLPRCPTCGQVLRKPSKPQAVDLDFLG